MRSGSIGVRWGKRFEEWQYWGEGVEGECHAPLRHKKVSDDEVSPGERGSSGLTSTLTHATFSWLKERESESERKRECQRETDQDTVECGCRSLQALYLKNSPTLWDAFYRVMQ